MKKKLLFLLAAVFITGLGALYGQGKTASGTVIDSGTKEPLPGVDVKVKGTTEGTVTDVDGKFELTLPEGSNTLVFEYVGYEPQELLAKNSMSVLLESTTVLTGVEVEVAYGQKKGKGYAGSAQTIGSKIIEEKNPSDITKAMAGEFSGVQVVTTSGQPGTTSTVRLRGIGSVNSSTAPLYVVDGVPFQGDINAIDPNDIASTTVLKDATSTALYGARGANGVILITTKKGTSSSDDKIEVDLKYGGNMRLTPLYNTIKSPERYVELGWQGLVTYFNGNKTQASAKLFDDGTVGVDRYYNLWDCNNGSGVNLIDPETGKFTGVARDYNPEDWAKNIYSVGQKIEATVKFHGGSDKVQYYTSFGYLKDEGYYISSNYDRFSARSNIDAQPKKWLKLNLNMQYSYTDMSYPGQNADQMNNGFQFVNGIPAIYPVFRYDKKVNGVTGRNKVWSEITNDWMYDYGDGISEYSAGRSFGLGINPAGSLKWDKEQHVQHQFVGSTRMEIQFYKDLKFVSTVGFLYNGLKYSDLTNKFYGDAGGVGHIYKELDEYLALTATQQLIYNTTVADDHHIDAFIAHETSQLKVSYMYGQMSQIFRPDGIEWGNAASVGYMGGETLKPNNIHSVFGQVRYNWKERYFIDGNMRYDGSSNFAPGHQWGLFGSVGASWIITNEPFMHSSKSWLKNLKYKISWGHVGNSDIRPLQYTDRYSLTTVNGLNALIWSQRGNPNITWESSNILNTGIEFKITKYLTGEFEYFYKTTDNMLWQYTVPPSLGYLSYWVNDGKLANQGVELQLVVNAVNSRNVKLDIRLNAAKYWNKILKMPIDAITGERKILDGNLSKGHGVFDWMMPTSAGLNDIGQALYEVYYDDKTGDPITNLFLFQHLYPDRTYTKGVTTDWMRSTDNYVGKSAFPDLYGGLGIDFTAYGFDLSVLFTYSIGGYGYDNLYAALMHSSQWGTYAWHEDINKAWTPENTNTDIPRLANGLDEQNNNYANAASTRFLTSNSYLQLANVRLGYSLPKKMIDKVKLNNLNFWVSGDNLFVITARKGYLPMAAFDGSNNTSQYAPLTTIMGGIKFTF